MAPQTKSSCNESVWFLQQQKYIAVFFLTVIVLVGASYGQEEQETPFENAIANWEKAAREQGYAYLTAEIDRMQKELDLHESLVPKFRIVAKRVVSDRIEFAVQEIRNQNQLNQEGAADENQGQELDQDQADAEKTLRKKHVADRIDLWDVTGDTIIAEFKHPIICNRLWVKSITGCLPEEERQPYLEYVEQLNREMIKLVIDKRIQFLNSTVVLNTEQRLKIADILFDKINSKLEPDTFVSVAQVRKLMRKTVGQRTELHRVIKSQLTAEQTKIFKQAQKDW